MSVRIPPLSVRNQNRAKAAKRNLAAPLALCAAAVFLFVFLQAWVHGKGVKFSGKVSISGGLFLATAHLHNIPVHRVLPETFNLTSVVSDGSLEADSSEGTHSSVLLIEYDEDEDSASLDPAVHLFGGSAQAAALERDLNENATVGFCEKGKPLLSSIPAQVCQELFCLWSHSLKADIDLSFSMLQLLPQEVTPHHCPIAQGGQVGTVQLGGMPPTVSLILLVGNDDLLAAQTFMQLFRTAHEASSAEFVLVENPTTDQAEQQPQQAQQHAPQQNMLQDDVHPKQPTFQPRAKTLLNAAAKRVGAYFGTQLKLVSAATVLGAGPPSPNYLQPSHWMQAQAGLRAARGRYAVVIPAGTFAIRGWLHGLIQTFEAHPHAGMVGPLVLSGSGVVRDAGGVLHRDGSYSLVGAGELINNDLLHMRQVDFISPYCVALRRDEALAAGGWDPRLGNELGNVDLALAMQQRGFTVLLQPSSVVLAPESLQLDAAAPDFKLSTRREGVVRESRQQGSAEFIESSSKNVPFPLVKQHSAAQPAQDLRVLQQKWDTVLQLRYCPPPPPARTPWKFKGQLMLGGAAAALHVLWIDDTVPTPDKDSGSVRLMALIKILLEEGYDVSFQPRIDADKAYNLALQAAGVRVLPSNPLRLRSWSIQRGSYCLYDAFVVARRPNYNRTVSLLDEACPGVPQIFDTVDLHFLREARDEMSARGLQRLLHTPDLVRWLRSGAQLLAKDSPAIEGLLRHRDKELELIAHANATLIVSEEEMEVVKYYLSGHAHRLHLVSNVYQTSTAGWTDESIRAEGNGPESDPPTSGSTCQGRKGLLFVGNYNHKPNADAVLYLVKHVLPRIRKKMPKELAMSVQAHIVGSGELPRSTETLLRNNFKFVQYHGYLPNDLLQVLYSSVKVAVAPLTTGAGVKGKVNQAMQLGVPIVATSIAVEGMHAEDGKHCLIGNTAEELAEKIVAVYTNCTLWDSLVAGGKANLQQHFSHHTARDALMGALHQAGVPAVDRHQQVQCTQQPYL